MVRVLDVLNEISAGPRLLLILNQLTHHRDPRIASKAVMLMARRVGNNQWVKNRLDSGDARLRASVVEGLWGVNTAAARKTLWASLEDESNRVVGNALLGLHMLGEPMAGELVRAMLEDKRPPFRWTAAWVMGKTGRDEFVELLQRSLGDGEKAVRHAARRALIAIRQAAIARQLESEAHARKQEEEDWRAALAAAAARSVSPAEPVPPDEDHVRPEEKALPELEIHLDGSYISSRVNAARPRRRLWPF
jgi:HEAT repeat protein